MPSPLIIRKTVIGDKILVQVINLSKKTMKVRFAPCVTRIA